MSSRPVVPALAFLAVLGMALMLIVGIVLRPWNQVTADVGAPGYNRSQVGIVGVTDQVDWSHSTLGGAFSDRGQAGFVAYGCASCHGLDGRGTRWAPMSVINADQVRAMVRVGPRGMPVYSKEYLVDEDVDAIAAWLLQQKASAPKTQTPTPTPTPTTTTAPTTPAGSTTTQPAPTGTPEPTTTPVSGDAAKGAALYTSLSCAACHGQGGKGGFAAALNTPEFVGKYATDDSLAAIIRSGKGAMSGYDANRLPDASMADLVAYIRSLAQ